MIYHLNIINSRMIYLTNSPIENIIRTKICAKGVLSYEEEYF